MLKRILCALMAGLLLLSCVSCGVTPNDTTAEDTAETTTEAAETLPTPDLPEKDYGGADFRILCENPKAQYLLATESTGSVINDAVLEANHAVSQQFHINFTQFEGDMETLILSGVDEYDVAYIHDVTTASLSLQGLFYNAYELPYLDPTAEWWPEFTVDSLTLNGKMFYFSNYSSYLSMEWTRVCFFNQRLLEEYKLESPYDHVRAGTWTLDTITQMSTAMYSDLNGDSAANEGDIFGFACNYYPFAWLESFGIEMYEKEAPDSAVLTLDTKNERAYTLIDKLHTWFYSGENGVHVTLDDTREKGIRMFANDQVGFTFAEIGTIAPLAIENDIQYGIVPFPKIDGNEKNYYGGCTDCLYSVPVTLKDTERAGIILEAMAYEGYTHIRPAYCDKILETRYATDPDCSEMLKLILDNQVISFAFLFATAVPNGMQFRFIAETVKENNVASFYKSKQRQEMKMMEKITDFYS